MKFVSDTACLIACLSIALALRLAVILHEPGQLSIDRDAYLGIANSVAEGRGYSSPNSAIPTAFRPPLYPLMLAIGFRLIPQLPVVAEINLLAGLLTVCLTASLGKHLQLGRLRYLAALLVGIDPLLLQYSARPMTESICACLTALWLWSIIGGWPRTSPLKKGSDPLRASDDALQTDRPRFQSGLALGRGLVTGFAFGLLVLSRPTFWPMAGFFVLWWLYDRRRAGTNDAENRGAAWIQTGVGSAVGTFLTVIPWLARNWLVFGVPILTTTHGGYTLLLGNNPVFYEQVVSKPWGAAWPDDSQRQWEADRRSQMERDIGPGSNEIEQDRWNSRQAWSYIQSHPVPTFQAAIHRVRSLWNILPQGDAASGVNPLVLIGAGSYYAIVLIACLIGLALILRGEDRAKWMPLFLLILSVQLVHLLYWTNTRMRAPLTPAIALFAAATVSTIGKKTVDRVAQTLP